nr:hypothetical protein [Tanacetum cinerariifolium]
MVVARLDGGDDDWCSSGCREDKGNIVILRTLDALLIRRFSLLWIRRQFGTKTFLERGGKEADARVFKKGEVWGRGSCKKAGRRVS